MLRPHSHAAHFCAVEFAENIAFDSCSTACMSRDSAVNAAHWEVVDG